MNKCTAERTDAPAYAPGRRYVCTQQAAAVVHHSVLLLIFLSVLQDVSIACYSEPCISYGWDVRLSVCLCPSVCHALALSK